MTKKLLLGNEAFAHAALEAGVRVVAGYPGTPSSELIETVARLRAKGRAHDVYVEWSTNEKAALEVCFGASLSGARALFTCKQVGLNVASDALMSLNYVGVRGGLVLFVADDPGPISSQTEQDTRRFAAFAKVPVLDPATPEQGFAMMKAAFDLSEAYQTPVIVRPTTRVNHASTFFDVEDVTHAKPLKAGGFQHDPERMVIFPKRSYQAHGEINKRLRDIARDFTFDPLFDRMNPSFDRGRTPYLGIMCGGVSTQYAREALRLIEGEAAAAGMTLPPVRFIQVGTPYPFPKRTASRFLDGLSHVLVLEELDSVLEEDLLKAAANSFLSAHVHGRLTGEAPARGENSTEICARSIARFFDAYARKEDIAATAADRPSPSAGHAENSGALREREARRHAGTDNAAGQNANAGDPGDTSPINIKPLMTARNRGNAGGANVMANADPGKTAPFAPVFPKHSQRLVMPASRRRTATTTHAARYKAPTASKPHNASAAASATGAHAVAPSKSGGIRRAGAKDAAQVREKFTFEQLVARAIGPDALPKYDGELPVRPPVLCAGCPHRGSFYAMKNALDKLRVRREDAVFCGDIGCYTLGNAEPLDAVDTCLCMGGGITMAQGVNAVQPDKKQIAFVGDSTFFASGLTGIVNAVYNQHDITICVLDNSTTAMTGSQPHPGTGVTLMGQKSAPISIQAMLEAMGVQVILQADPLNRRQAEDVCAFALRHDGPSAIIFKSPCVQLKAPDEPARVQSKKCTGCKRCIADIGCPAISFSVDAHGPKSGNRGQAVIDADLCTGCGLCAQVCPFDAIRTPNLFDMAAHGTAGDPLQQPVEPMHKRPARAARHAESAAQAEGEGATYGVVSLDDGQSHADAGHADAAAESARSAQTAEDASRISRGKGDGRGTHARAASESAIERSADQGLFGGTFFIKLDED